MNNVENVPVKNQAMIYHIFKADAYFHTIDMIECIIKFSEFKHFFIVVGINELTKPYFDNLFQKNNYSLYKYIFENSSSKKTIIISNLFTFFFKTEFKKFEIDLLKYITKISPKCIILHSNYSSTFYFLFSKKNRINKTWVCWGSIYNPRNLDNIKIKISKYLYKRIYKNFSTIVCTMEPDCKQLNKSYNIIKTKFIPYHTSLSLISESIIPKETNINNKSIKILLGNSGRCIESYYNDLNKLKIYNNENITIDCMLNYGSSNSQNLDFIKFATTIYAGKFTAHTILWSKEHYYNFMNEFDIYISSVLKQSGLGAIYLLLISGKKIFLAGNNYTHLKNLNAIIYNSELIGKLTYGDFCKPLSMKEKFHNNKIVQKLLNTEELSKKWDKLYSSLL